MHHVEGGNSQNSKRQALLALVTWYKHGLDLLPQPDPEWKNSEEAESGEARLRNLISHETDSSRRRLKTNGGSLKEVLNHGPAALITEELEGGDAQLHTLLNPMVRCQTSQVSPCSSSLSCLTCGNKRRRFPYTARPWPTSKHPLNSPSNISSNSVITHFFFKF